MKASAALRNNNQVAEVSGDDALMFHSNIKSLPLIHRGKVRDSYDAGRHRRLLVATDRLSAFDVVLADAIPRKGAALTSLSLFWLNRLKNVVPNHLIDLAPETVVLNKEYGQVAGRAMLTKELRPVPFEAIVRGYLVGSGYKDYQKTGVVCGITLPSGLRLAEQLHEPIFTPSTKAVKGHDENVDFDEMVKVLGPELAEQIREVSIKLYLRAAQYAFDRGIIIADTKFEFGVDEDGKLYLIDEVLTPDSSRFWPVDQYKVGENPPSFDKQYVRDWLEASGWDKKSPAPRLPQEVIEMTAQKYAQVVQILTA